MGFAMYPLGPSAEDVPKAALRRNTNEAAARFLGRLFIL